MIGERGESIEVPNNLFMNHFVKNKISGIHNEFNYFDKFVYEDGCVILNTSKKFSRKTQIRIMQIKE